MNLEIITSYPKGVSNKRDILFIHGVYHAAWSWENFLPYFSERGFTAHAMSLRGHGNSEGKELLKKAGVDDYLEDVANTIARFDGPPILIGHSLGGMLIRKYIEKNEVPAAVLISAPTPRAMKDAGPVLLKSWPWKTFKFIVTKNPDLFHHNMDVLSGLYFSNAVPRESIEKHLNRLLAQGESYRIFQELARLEYTRPRALPPVLVIGGGKDLTLTSRNFLETAEMYGTKPVIIDDKPHDMMLIPGWEKVADHIIAWLKKNKQ